MSPSSILSALKWVRSSWCDGKPGHPTRSRRRSNGADWRGGLLVNGPFDWQTCPPLVGNFLEESVSLLVRQLQENLVGVYLHGSLATGSFYSPKSDLDLLVVVKRRIEPPDRRSLAQALLELSDRRPSAPSLELSILLSGALQPFEHPLPFELHFSSKWMATIRVDAFDYDRDRRDPDLAAHCAVVRARGIQLYGAGIVDTFPPIPHELYIDSILDDLQWILVDDRILEAPIYGVLNICRVLCVLRGGPTMPSKEEAAAWALRCLPEKFRSTIQAALNGYRSPDPMWQKTITTQADGWDVPSLISFRDWVLSPKLEPAAVQLPEVNV
jgi:predicted nucleotidyltransferase